MNAHELAGPGKKQEKVRAQKTLDIAAGDDADVGGGRDY